MSDLIRRQDAIDAVKKRMHETMDYQDLYLPIHLEMCMEEALDTEYLPSAQPERKKGKWRVVSRQADSFTAYRCSECNELVYARTNFCPNCGADMRGENNGQLAEG